MPWRSDSGGVVTVQPSRAPGFLALAFLCLALAAGFLPVVWMGISQGTGAADAYILRVLSFTLLQAGLSTVLSVALGLLLARALARRQVFPGRGLVLRLLNLPLALPSIVVIIGIIEVYGTKGWLGGQFSIYGLQGILLAHVFFNLPLAARLMLAELERVPAESWKLAAQLGFRASDIWRLVEWPQLRAGLPGIALLIFLLCASSFAVVLTLGGGPRATTLEVAIYQALRADFDPQRAVMLAIVQLLLCGSLVLLAQKWGGLAQGFASGTAMARRFDGQVRAAKIIDTALIAAGLLLLLPPLLAILLSGMAAIHLDTALARAASTSLALGTASAALAFALAWPLSSLAARSGSWRRWSGLAVLAAWIVPPAVLATGWFITLIAHAGSTALAACLVIAMNGLMALPFVFQPLSTAIAQAAQAHDRLCLGLGLSGWTRFRLIDVPALKRPIGLSLVMALILSLGDLTAISLFGTQDFTTLPALIYRQMGSYRFDEAIGTALVLGALVLALSTLSERWSRAR
jgi:thiamine transport system permease protein